MIVRTQPALVWRIYYLASCLNGPVVIYMTQGSADIFEYHAKTDQSKLAWPWVMHLLFSIILNVTNGNVHDPEWRIYYWVSCSYWPMGICMNLCDAFIIEYHAQTDQSELAWPWVMHLLFSIMLTLTNRNFHDSGWCIYYSVSCWNWPIGICMTLGDPFSI